MSEYQYYEFAAVDRPLDTAARAELRAISSRARISATSFVNSYEWGDLKADPIMLLERHFDLFLYVANWGTRRFALRLPKRFLAPAAVGPFELDDELVTIRPAGEHVIVDIHRDEVEADDGWDDGSGSLAALSSLRSALIAGDLSLFSLLWLVQVDLGLIADGTVEPPPGIAPLTAPLSALADFLGLDGDLLEAAARAPDIPAGPSADEVERVIRAIPEAEKIALLRHLHAGDDPHLGAELRRRCRAAAKAPRQASGRTAGDLRAAARLMSDERRRLAEAREAAERRRREREQAQARSRHLADLARRGEAVWREVEDLIGLRNASAYDRAAALIVDLGAVAAAGSKQEDFARRIATIGSRHERKRKFIARLDAAGMING